MVSRKVFTRIGGGLGIVVAALIALAFLTWPALPMGIAVSNSQPAPELLRDIQWPNTLQSAQFAQRFATGTDEILLVEWLEDEEFVLGGAATIAERSYESIPCLRSYRVIWSSENGKLTEPAVGMLTNYACL